MSDKIVVVTGAGFSYPAKLPIQNRIIAEMLSKPEIGFMGTWDFETVEFYRAYIEVGIFLIENYTKRMANPFRQKFKAIVEGNARVKAENEFISSLLKKKSIANEVGGTKHLKKVFSEKGDIEAAVLKNALIKSMATLKEEIRCALAEEHVNVDLEDLFTKLDKCVQSQRNWKNYSFIKVVKIKQYILELFVYYFGKKNAEFKIDDSYASFARYIEKNKVSVVTTNWDTICEQIFAEKRVKFDPCFSDISYYNVKKQPGKPKIAKIHGSINWFSCLNCGSVAVKSTGKEAPFLLSDEKKVCCRCKAKQVDDFIFAPEIITPTMVKSFTKQLYTNIWQNAEYILKDATQIIFVGYSMPLADFEFRYMLTKYVSANAKIHVVLHESDEKKEGEKREVPEDRYRCAFPKNDILFFYDGFKTYFDNLMSST